MGAPGRTRPLHLDDAYQKRLEAAGSDVDKLWDLAIWCEDTGRDKEASSVLRRLIRIDPDHRRAREKLGHILYDGQWFTSEKKLAKYKAEEEARRAKEQGLVEFDGRWVDPGDLPFLERGLVRGPDGAWRSPEELKKLEEGWVLQDLIWIAPDEVDQLDAGLWKCGEEWLDLAAANRFHRRIEHPWRIPGEGVILRTTAARETAEKALPEMERAYREMRRVFGRLPAEPVEAFLAGRADELGLLCSEGLRGHGPIDGRGLIESMEALFGESWIDPESGRWLGAGVSWWDPNESDGDKYGVHRARFALGLSFVEALDPSPKSLAKLRKARKKGLPKGFAASYYAEKKLPPWLRWGSAVYAARYYRDQVQRGGDPFWTRVWSVENLKRRGGLPPLDEVFSMEVSGGPSDTRFTLAAGLVVAFLVDGSCVEVRERMDEFRAAFREGKETGKILAKLRKEVEKHEKELRAFAGL